MLSLVAHKYPLF